MKNSVSESKFQAEPNSHEYERSKGRIYEWVPKYQIIAASIIIFQCMYFASTNEGWKGYLANLLAIVILYFILSGIFNRIRMYIESRDKELSNLRRQFAGFICDTTLGKVSEIDLKRLATAANDLRWKSDQTDLSKDDFNLISRTWFFWRDQNGFQAQDETECINCGQIRMEHSKDGTCSS